MSSFGETNVNNYNLDSMDNAHDTKKLNVMYLLYVDQKRKIQKVK